MSNLVEISETSDSTVEAVINTPTGPWFLQFAQTDEPGQLRLGMQGPDGWAAMALTPDELESFAMALVQLAGKGSDVTTNIAAGQVWETKDLPGDTAGIKILVMQVHGAWYVDYVYLRDVYKTDPNGLPTVPAYGNPIDRFTRDFQLVSESMSDFVNRDVQ